MNAGELPMILFTTIAMMCVGVFVILGVIQFLAGSRYSERTLNRATDLALIFLGPAMVFGLIASMFHMHDVFHVFNVFRHLGSSWLSREVTFGIIFAGLGFVFAFMQWWKLGSLKLRQILAVLTALAGIGLLVSMVRIYTVLKVVPAWSSWFTPVQVVCTTVVLGSLLVAAAFVLTRKLGVSQWEHAKDATFTRAMVGAKRSDAQRSWYQRIDDETANTKGVSESLDDLVGWAVRLCVVLAVVAAGVLLISFPFYVTGLASKGGAALASARTFASFLTVFRFACLVVGIGLLGVFAYYMTSRITDDAEDKLAWVVTAAFLLVLLGEFLGRYQFYESMVRVGM